MSRFDEWTKTPTPIKYVNNPCKQIDIKQYIM